MRDFAQARGRQKYTLNQMVAGRFITSAQASEAYRQEAAVVPKRVTPADPPSTAPEYADIVTAQLQAQFADDPDSLETISRVLRKRGHEAVGVQSPRTAMALLIADTPDFAVFDLKMPEMTGLELLRAMRSYLRLQHLPVVIVTAYPEAPELRDVGKFGGVVGVLPKVNLDLTDLALLVERNARPTPPGPDHAAGHPPRA